MTEPHDSIYQVTFLRHAESIANQENILQGQLDSTLSEVGIQQAQALAVLWQNEQVTFDVVISSPLERARKTAEVVTQSMRVNIEESDLLKERGFGIAEGRPYKEVNSSLQERMSRSPFEPVFETGESDWDLFTRASSVIKDILERDPGKILVVSHGGFLNAALHCILGNPPTVLAKRSIINLDNTGYAIAKFYPSASGWIIGKVNDTRHLISASLQG